MTEKIGAGGRCDAGPVKAISNNVQAPNSADVAQSQSKNRTPGRRHGIVVFENDRASGVWARNFRAMGWRAGGGQ